MDSLKSYSKPWIVSGCALFLAFTCLLLCISFIDVQPIGPNNSLIGLAELNSFFFTLCGTSEIWDAISDGLLVFSFVIVIFFVVLGVIQLARSRSISGIDCDLLMLAMLYLAIAGVYALFEFFEVNYRPILEDGVLEASFPSSHSMVMTAIFLSAVYEAHLRVKNDIARRIIPFALVLLAILANITRLLSGAHWFTDVLAGALIASSFVCFFIAFSQSKNPTMHKRAKHARHAS